MWVYVGVFFIIGKGPIFWIVLFLYSLHLFALTLENFLMMAIIITKYFTTIILFSVDNSFTYFTINQTLGTFIQIFLCC